MWMHESRVRKTLDAAVRTSDRGHLPKQWPRRYKSVIDAVIALLEPGEQVRAAWRMRTTGPRERFGDVGLVVVTDRRVIGHDHSPDRDGAFAVPVGQVAEIALERHIVGDALRGECIRLTGADHMLLGDMWSPSEFQVFAACQDPSGEDTHVRGYADLAEVQQSLAALLPWARTIRMGVYAT